ncbi:MULTISPECIES: DUF4942 domain-containing protein [unclassified Pseudomonas]|uniref:DUF4942 domain-containing protein n=1 Tax=unclassified Pseudomonas TaxID=196821 RepID=UPI0010F8EE32|nr:MULTISPECIES: DUF4942 domain-containing protein [unclassified Pseudomonas]
MTHQHGDQKSLHAVSHEVFHPIEGDLVDPSERFFAPVQADLVDRLLGEYTATLNNMNSVVDFMSGQDFRSTLHYFIEGNSLEPGQSASVSSGGLFSLEGAVAYLNSTYWTKALALTDVYEAMPKARRDEWDNQIKSRQAPDFEETTVRSTLNALLSDRTKFFAEQVDGIFRALSGDHVTNKPEGFTKIFIINHMLYKDGGINYENAGYIHDLRCVIAKFMGRSAPRYGTSGPLLEAMQRDYGTWHIVDGGALRMRLYKRGTVHCEVNPDLAWSLNSLLATLYPTAIPPKFRTRPKNPHKEFQLIGKPLPFEVIHLLADMVHPGRVGRDEITANPYALRFKNFDKNEAKKGAENVLHMLGGVRMNINAFIWYEFDYDPRSALDRIIISGCVPDQKSHQFYPTPDTMSDEAVEMADIQDDDEILEPSAGQGGIACKLPKSQTTCVEISSLHCQILRAKGFNTVEGDFLKWAASTTRRFSCVIMNPPFSDGRALAHLQAASELLIASGRLVAILPASLKNKNVLPGWTLEWSKVYSNEFDGTGVSVVMVKAIRSVH